MITKTYILVLTLAVAAMTASSPAAPVIEEGVFLDEAEGLLKLNEQADSWQFVPDDVVELTADKTFPAGEALPMLPCSVLEQMTQLAGEENQLRVRLWAVFTEYKGENSLFSVYFLPIGEKAAPVQTPQEPPVVEDKDEQQPVEKKASDSIIPEDILKQIRSAQTPDLKKFEQIARVSGDRSLFGRTGYLQEQNGVRVFHSDGFGRNINHQSLVLLPNKMRADAEERMGHTPGKQRYTVSGLITTYKGQDYMLLRRVQRTFSNGNFTP